jgi:DNA-directed RNA polymerase subunit H (RpoH/RPB5)
MDKLSEQKEIIKLEKKLNNLESGDLVASYRRLGESELQDILATLAIHAHSITTIKNEDIELQQAKEALSELNAPYREQLSAIKLKSRFVALLLQEKTKSE